MSPNARRTSPLLCLLVAMLLPWAGTDARAEVSDPPTWDQYIQGCSGQIRILTDTGVVNARQQSFTAQVTVEKDQMLWAAATRAGETSAQQKTPVVGWISVIGPDGRELYCEKGDNMGHLRVSLPKVPASGVYQVKVLTWDTANKYAISTTAGLTSAVGDCGVHDTNPVAAAGGGVTYPDEHVFPASIALQKGDNLGFIAIQRGDNVENQVAPVNGWVYIYRPDGRLLACTRNDTAGRLILSFRGVPDTGLYHLRMVSHDMQPYDVYPAKWTDAQATLTSGSHYVFKGFFPQQSIAFTVNVPKAGGNLTVAFNDNNTHSNAFAQITGPNGRSGMVDLGNTGYKLQVQQAGNYTIKVIPKPGTRLVGAIEAIVD